MISLLIKYTLLAVFFLSSSFIYCLSSKIKDITRISTLRENQLSGYGVVIGLPQTGDSKSTLGASSLTKLLAKRGIAFNYKQLQSKNVAAVMVMAKIPAFARVGDRIDIWVSSIGDASSLSGGYLLQTPLYGANNKVYAVAQVNISVVKEAGRGFSRDKVATIHVPKGAIIEKPVNQPITFKVKNKKSIKLSLIQFDIETAKNIIVAINKKFLKSASLNNDASINVIIPNQENALKFISDIYQLEVEVKNKARVVIDTQTGTIVMGEKVAISPVTITKDGIEIQIKNNKSKSLVFEDDKKKKTGNSQFIGESPDVKKLMQTLNKLGLNVKKIIEILKAIHAAGALHGELIML